MRNRLIATATLTAACAASLLGAGAAHATTATHRAPTRVVGDCEHAQYEPRTITIACGDDGVFFKNLTWSSWSARSARGSGQLWVNTDDPDAAAGHWDVQTVRLTLERPTTVHGKPRFSRIAVPYRSHNRTKIEYLYPPTTSER